jgi:hypothetical protein
MRRKRCAGCLSDFYCDDRCQSGSLEERRRRPSRHVHTALQSARAWVFHVMWPASLPTEVPCAGSRYPRTVDEVAFAGSVAATEVATRVFGGERLPPGQIYEIHLLGLDEPRVNIAGEDAGTGEDDWRVVWSDVIREVQAHSGLLIRFVWSPFGIDRSTEDVVPVCEAYSWVPAPPKKST